MSKATSQNSPDGDDMYVGYIVPPDRLHEKRPKRGLAPAYATTAILRRMAYLAGRINPNGFKTCFRKDGPVEVLGRFDGSEEVCEMCGHEFLDWAQLDANRAWQRGEMYPAPTP